MDTIQVDEFNANLNNLIKITKMYDSVNQYRKYRPPKWVQFCAERMIAYIEELNNG